MSENHVGYCDWVDRVAFGELRVGRVDVEEEVLRLEWWRVE